MDQNTPQQEALEAALQTLKTLAVPEHLQEQALQYLLSSTVPQPPFKPQTTSPASPLPVGDLTDLQAFMASKNPPKYATAEVPCLVYWAKAKDNKDSVNEDDIRQLYRLSGRTYPKVLAQTLRDLASKRYERLESVSGKVGYYQLSKVGEHFVEVELKKQSGA